MKAQVRQPRVLSAFCRRRTDQHYNLALAIWWLQGASRLRRVGLSKKNTDKPQGCKLSNSLLRVGNLSGYRSPTPYTGQKSLCVSAGVV